MATAADPAPPAPTRPAATSTHPPRTASRQSQRSVKSSESDDPLFFDTFTTAAQSRPASPSAAVHSSEPREGWRNSFQTALDRSQTNSPRGIPGVDPPPLPARLENERQRWRLSHQGRSTTFPGTYPSSDTASSIVSIASPNPAGETARAQKHSPAAPNGHGVGNVDGPAPALLSRTPVLTEPTRKPSATRTFVQRSLQPLKLLSLKGNRSRQDSVTTVTPKLGSEDSNTRERPPIPRAPRSEILISPKTRPSPSADGRPKSTGNIMATQAIEEYFEDHGTPSDAGVAPPLEEAESGTGGQSSEDVFLNLAKDTSQRHSLQDRMERRRSRIARPAQRQSLPASTALSQTDSSERDSIYGAPSAFDQRLQGRRPSQIATTGLGQYRDASPVSSAGGLNRLEAYKQRYYPSQRTPVQNGLKSPESASFNHRTPSITDSPFNPHQRPHAYRPTKLNSSYQDYETSSNVGTPPDPGRKRAPSRANADGTESVGSGVAPSTMWDELEDLKSRIRRMELTGKSSSTSGAAVQSSASGSNERPRTATTTVTTISSSPKHAKANKQHGASDPSALGDNQEALTGIHPLLRQALVRCKTVLKPDLYRILEASAAEALEMAAMAGNAGPQGTVYTAATITNGATFSDRQVRRKADNICRTLTELCIGLCESQGSGIRKDSASTSPAITEGIEERPGSRAGHAGTERAMTEEPQASASAYGQAMRSSSLEPELAGAITRGSPSRAMSRIEARRNSLNLLAMSASNSASNSPRDVRPSIESDFPSGETAQQQQQQQQQQRYSGLSHFSRAGTSLLRTRRRVDDEDTDEEAAVRPVSRAMTDVANAPQSHLRIPSLSRRERQAHRLSREYTSDEPLPEQHQLPLQQYREQQQGQASSLRRVTGSQLPQSTSLLRGSTAESRRYLDRTTPPLNYEGAGPGSAEERRQRISSLGSQYPASRRSSAGLSLGRKLASQRMTVEAGGSGLE